LWFVAVELDVFEGALTYEAASNNDVDLVCCHMHISQDCEEFLKIVLIGWIASFARTI